MIQIIIGVFIIAVAAALGWFGTHMAQEGWKEWKQSEVATTIKEDKALKKPEEITLLYLFENDFNNLLRSGKDASFVDNEGLKVNFKTKEYFDFEAQSKFIGFYIPSSPKTLELLEHLPETYKSLSSKDEVMVEMSAPGVQPVNISELNFSGRVFIYHEYPVLEAQKRELYTLYEKHGLAPQFRGSDYLYKKKEIKGKAH